MKKVEVVKFAPAFQGPARDCSSPEWAMSKKMAGEDTKALEGAGCCFCGKPLRVWCAATGLPHKLLPPVEEFRTDSGMKKKENSPFHLDWAVPKGTTILRAGRASGALPTREMISRLDAKSRAVYGLSGLVAPPPDPASWTELAEEMAEELARNARGRTRYYSEFFVALATMQISAGRTEEVSKCVSALSRKNLGDFTADLQTSFERYGIAAVRSASGKRAVTLDFTKARGMQTHVIAAYTSIFYDLWNSPGNAEGWEVYVKEGLRGMAKRTGAAFALAWAGKNGIAREEEVLELIEANEEELLGSAAGAAAAWSALETAGCGWALGLEAAAGSLSLFGKSKDRSQEAKALSLVFRRARGAKAFLGLVREDDLVTAASLVLDPGWARSVRDVEDAWLSITDDKAFAKELSRAPAAALAVLATNVYEGKTSRWRSVIEKAISGREEEIPGKTGSLDLKTLLEMAGLQGNLDTDRKLREDPVRKAARGELERRASSGTLGVYRLDNGAGPACYAATAEDSGMPNFARLCIY